MKKLCILLAALCLALCFAVSAYAAVGDANNDKKITSADARYVLRTAVNLEYPENDVRKRCDADHDGKVTSADARLVLRVSVKLDEFTHPAPTGEEATVGMKPATCTAPGVRYYLCACGEKRSEPIPAKGHSPAAPKTEQYKKSTCSAVGGYESVVYCSACGEELSREHKTVEKLPHTPLEPVFENYADPTCAAEGGFDEVTYCEVCGEEVSRESFTVPMLPHKEIALAAAPEACIGAGPVYFGDTYYRCAGCGTYFTDPAGESPLGGMYATLAEALAAAREGETVILLKNAALAEDVSVPAGVTLLLPYGYGTNEIFVGSAETALPNANAAALKNEDGADAAVPAVTPAGEDVSVLLTLNGCTLTVPETARLVIGGTYSGGQPIGGGTCGRHAEIVLNDDAGLAVSGILSTYGYITGTGEVTLSGGSLYEPLVITDYHGGTYSVNTYFKSLFTSSNAFPFNGYGCCNVQCPVTMDGASSMFGYCVLYANEKQNAAASVLISSGQGLLQPEPGAVLRLTYDPVSVAGYEGIGRVSVTADGNVNVENLELKAAGTALQTKYMYFPVPLHFAYTQASGTLTLNQSLKLMPGTELTVKENAVLDVQSALCVLDGFTPGQYSYYHYPAGDKLAAAGLPERARLILNGEMTVADEAVFAGTAETDGAGHIVLSDAAVLTVTLTDGFLLNEAVLGKSIATSKVDLFLTARCVTAGGTLTAMKAGAAYTAVSGAETALYGYEYEKYVGDVESYTTQTVRVDYVAPQVAKGVWAAE